MGMDLVGAYNGYVFSRDIQWVCIKYRVCI